MQEPAIKASKELGCEVVVVDGNPEAVSVKLADKFFPIDLKDIPSLINCAKKLKANGGLDAVFTAATDFSASVASVAKACGLPGHSLEAAISASDKIKMRECFKRNSVPSPNFVKIEKSEIADAENILKANGVNFPITVKPADNMGARGCKLVFSPADLSESLSEAVFYSRTGKAVAEEFIEGEEFSLEALVINEEIFITAVADRHIFFPPHFVEMGHTIPSNHKKEEIAELIRVFKLGIKALNLTNGAAKGDIFLRKANQGGERKACIGEIAARLSGGYMSGWTVPYSSGLDVTKEAIKIALGKYENNCNNKAAKELADLNFTKVGFSAERAWISVPGKIKKIYGIEEAKKTPFIKDVLIRSNENDEVVFPKNNVEKCGNILSSAPSYIQAVKASEDAVKKIVLRLEKNNPETEAFFKNTRLLIDEQEIYEPNFFILPKTNKIDKDIEHPVDKNTHKNNIYEMLKNSSLKTDGNIFYPACFETLLDTVFDIHHNSVREAIAKSFAIEPKLPALIKTLQKSSCEKSSKNSLGENPLSEESVKLWLYFIRGSIQGLLYFFDSY